MTLASPRQARAVHAHIPLEQKHVLHPSLHCERDAQPDIGGQVEPASFPAAPDEPPPDELPPVALPPVAVPPLLPLPVALPADPPVPPSGAGVESLDANDPPHATTKKHPAQAVAHRLMANLAFHQR